MTLEDLTKMELPAGLVLGVIGLIAARLLPEMCPQLKSVVKLGLALVGESEAEAEADIIDQLATRTVGALIDAIAETPSDDAARAKVEHTMQHFRQRARVHARRWAHDPAHVDRHYRRHVRRLRGRLEHEWQRQAVGDRHRYERVISRIDGELLSGPGGGTGPSA
jgi:hypothetical protein